MSRTPYSRTSFTTHTLWIHWFHVPLTPVTHPSNLSHPDSPLVPVVFKLSSFPICRADVLWFCNMIIWTT